MVNILIFGGEETKDKGICWCEWQVLFSRRYGMLLAVDQHFPRVISGI